MQQINSIIKSCSSNLNPSQIRKIQEIHKKISAGANIKRFHGKTIKQKPELIRFKIGQNFRLLYQKNTYGLIPLQIMTRQSFGKFLKRRC